MTRTIARLVLAMLMLPFTGIFLLLAFGVAVIIGGNPRPGEMLVAWTATHAFVVVYWIAVWRSEVVWTTRRRMHTFAAFGVGVIVSGIAMSVLRVFVGLPIEPTIMFSNALFPVVFVLATVLAWRESPAERHARVTERGTDTVSCPICAYNMTGLREAKCPECGAVFTLDELLTSQAKEKGEELTTT